MSSGFRKKYSGEPFKVTDSRNPMEINTSVIHPLLSHNVGYFVDYYRVCYDKGTHEELRFGVPSSIPYDNGLVGYAQCDQFSTLKQAQEFVENKRNTVNNWYCGFGIRFSTCQHKIGEYEHEIIKPCESVNKIVVDKLD